LIDSLRTISVGEMNEFTNDYLVDQLIKYQDENFRDLTDVILKSINRYFNLLFDEKTYSYAKSFLNFHILELHVVDIGVSSLADITTCELDLHNRRTLLLQILILMRKIFTKLRSIGINWTLKHFHLKS